MLTSCLLQSVRMRAVRYGRSPTARFAALVGLLAYLSYASARDGWTSPALIGTAVFFAVALPYYAMLSNALERRVMEATALVTPGRLARFAAQFTFNIIVMLVLSQGGLFGNGSEALQTLGGAGGAATLATAASQGAQFLGLFLARRGVGEPMRNVQVGISANIVASGAATVGLPEVSAAYVMASLAVGGVALTMGLLSDLRSLCPRRGGVAVFFGTFNPFHLGHLRCVELALQRRGVAKVVIHPTIVPQGHVIALARGELRVAAVERGFTVYATTDRADPLLNYFPTGDRFLPAEVRRDLIQASLDEAVARNPALAGRVEVAWMPEAYAAGGFPAVLRAIRRQHPGARVHVIHGTDPGGMMVRAIVDECGWVYPLAIRRIPGFSGTAVRAGVAGLTAQTVAERLARLANPCPPEVCDDRRAA